MSTKSGLHHLYHVYHHSHICIACNIPIILMHDNLARAHVVGVGKLGDVRPEGVQVHGAEVGKAAHGDAWKHNDARALAVHDVEAVALVAAPYERLRVVNNVDLLAAAWSALLLVVVRVAPTVARVGGGSSSSRRRRLRDRWGGRCRRRRVRGRRGNCSGRRRHARARNRVFGGHRVREEKTVHLRVSKTFK